jgi:hypothetical protein
MKATTTIALALLATFILSTDLAAQQLGTVAYWRHEEETANTLVPDGQNTVLDSSGNGNHMQTFSSTNFPHTAPTYTTNVSPVPLRSGAANTRSLDFGFGSVGGVPPGPEPNDDNYTANDKPIEEHVFTAMTVEAAFNMKTVIPPGPTGNGPFQALVGKDGAPAGIPEPPFKLVVRGDDFPNLIPNQLIAEWIDGDNQLQRVVLGETVTAGAWYHVAFTLTATNAELWVADETGTYTLRDSISAASLIDPNDPSLGFIGGDDMDFAGPQGQVMVLDPTPWAVGRGMFNNNVTDWSDAFIDEVRISDVALTTDQFLFGEPTTGQDADFDNDGDVDGQDFLIWQRGIGSAGTNMTGDANGDTNVDAADLTVWKSQFGGGAIQAVPEPAGAVLGMIALLSGAGLARHRHGYTIGRIS